MRRNSEDWRRTGNGRGQWKQRRLADKEQSHQSQHTMHKDMERMDWRGVYFSCSLLCSMCVCVREENVGALLQKELHGMSQCVTRLSTAACSCIHCPRSTSGLSHV